MKKLLTLSSIALALVLAPSLVQAHNHGGDKGTRSGGYFEKMDANGDGVISREEFLAKSAERFERMDLDGDGVITKEEMNAGAEKWREMRKEKREERKGDKKEHGHKKKEKSAE